MANKTAMVRFGIGLMDARAARKWTRKVLAEHADVSYETIQAIERDGRNPRLSTVDKLCTALGMTLEEVMGA